MLETKIGILIDVYNNSDGLYASIRTDSGKTDYFVAFQPYLYVLFDDVLNDQELKNLESVLENPTEIIKTSKLNTTKFVYKIIFKDVESLIRSREHLKSNTIFTKPFDLKEHNIHFLSRFFVDKQITNFKKIKFTSEDNKLLSFEVIDDVPVDELNYCTFDIEVLPPKDLSFPKPSNSPIISIALTDSKEKFVFVLVDDDSEAVKKNLQEKLNGVNLFVFIDEVKLVESFASFLGQIDYDVVFTYNGDGFDFSFLSERYNFLKVETLKFGNRSIKFNNKGRKSVAIDGVVHLDVYILIRLLNHLQVFNYSKLDLNTVYGKITGNPKLELPPMKMREGYFNKNYSELIKYNLDDVYATQDLGLSYINIISEISKLINQPIFEVLRGSTSRFVESWFFDYFTKNNLLIPDTPTQQQVSERYRYTFEGAFVKKPTAGLHKNIAILDFRSYHISLMIAYNISPETITLGENLENQKIKEDDNYFYILGRKISKKKKGFVPKLISNLLDIRIPIKEKIKTLNKNTREYKNLYAKQYALKIILASTYGYMGYPGARWYCRDCLDILYYLVRTKIQETISVFEKKGYPVIYSDTDSAFIHYDDLNQLKIDLKEVNDSLPNSMSLELENLFKSGIFVMSRDGEKAAKKKYALLGVNGELKVKGFELVRRDWCGLVKDTQRKVLETILEKEDPKAAIEYVKTIVKNLQNREVPKSKLIIQSFVRKNINNYKTINPAMSALLDAKKRGLTLSNKDVVEYIITGVKGKTISEKAKLAELVEEKDYDIDYYLNNQLMPAVFSILEIFNISKDEILTGKKQTGLGEFF